MRNKRSRWWLWLLLVLSGAVAGLLWTLLPATLGPVPALAVDELPQARPPLDMNISALRTGSVQSQAVLAYRGGKFGERRNFGMTAFLIQHPKGDLLIDAGFGENLKQHQEKLPWLMRATTEPKGGIPAGIQLKDFNHSLLRLRGVVLTHAHWDHVSGLDSLPGVPVWVNAAEQAFISSAPSAEVARSLGKLNWRPYEFTGGPYLGFPRSLDFFEDGSVVLVPAPGHTPGSIIVFVNLPSGERLVFLGDLVWQLEGISLPAERPWPARQLVDDDAAQVRALILQLAALQRKFPELRMIPAHDLRAVEQAGIPDFPKTRN